MGSPTKVQLIKRKQSQQWYINFPSAIAQAMQFKKGEIVEWLVSDLSQLVLRRQDPPPDPAKNNGSPKRLFRDALRGMPRPCPVIGRWIPCGERFIYVKVS